MKKSKFLVVRKKQVPIDNLETVITLDELIELQRAVKDVNVDDTIKSYIVDYAHRDSDIILMCILG